MKRWICRLIAKYADWALDMARKNPNISYREYRELEEDTKKFKTKFARYLK